MAACLHFMLDCDAICTNVVSGSGISFVVYGSNDNDKMRLHLCITAEKKKCLKVRNF